MDTLDKQNAKVERNYTGYLIGAAVGLLLIGIAIWLLSYRPSVAEQKAAVIEGAYVEGSPEFAELSNKLIFSTDDRTVESPNAFGAISMFIVGKIKYKGEKPITGLEINVAVIDQFNQVVKEKRVLVIPTQRARLEGSETIPVTLTLDGFKEKDDRANIRWKPTAIRTE